MLSPDFSRYSLALLENDAIIHSSSGVGLRPLWDALKKFPDRAGLVLHDKVMGLAAARLIVYSSCPIQDIMTTVVSAPAQRFLRENGIRLAADAVAANILTRNRSAVCPGEVIALDTDAPDVFLQKIRAMLNVDGSSRITLQ